MNDYEYLDGAIAIKGRYQGAEKGHDRLYIVYNPQLTSIKINQNTSIIPTIGAKYPLYRKNAIINYRSFSLGGMITYESQFDEKIYWEDKKPPYGFVTEEIRSSHILEDELLALTGEEKRSDHNYSFELERLFREKIIDFLTDGQPKIFESEQ